MNTIRLTDEQLGLARHALTAYLQAFGHREADTVADIRGVLAAFAAAEHEADGPSSEDRPHSASA